MDFLHEVISSPENGSKPLSSPLLSIDEKTKKDIETQGNKQTREFFQKNTLEKEKYMYASIYLNDALNTRSQHQTLRDSKVESMHLKIFFLVHNRMYRRFIFLIIFMHLILTNWERPSQRSPMQTNPYMLFLEFLFICIYVIDMSLRAFYQGKTKFLSDPWNKTKAFICLLMFIDIFLSAFFNIRWFKALRGFFLIEKGKQLRMHLQNSIKAFLNVLDVLFFLMFIQFFYSFLGLALFHGTEEGRLYFSNFEEGFMSLFVLMTTANYPDVMMPAYSENRLYAIFFISYLCFTLYFLMNLLLAIIYNGYKQQAREEIQKSMRFRQFALKRAFNLIQTDNTVTRECWQHLMGIFRPSYSLDKVNLMFNMLDQNDDNYLSQKEFFEVCTILQIHFRPIGDDSSLFQQRNFRKVMKMFLLSKPFRYFVNLLIFYTAFMTVFSNTEAAYLELYNIIRITFWIVSFIFLIELSLLIFSMGFKDFLSNKWLVVDGIFIILGFLGIILASRYSHGDRFLSFVFWSVNVLRIGITVERFRRILQSFGEVFSALVSFIIILLVLFYFFAIVGMELYWGKLERDNPRLIGTLYDSANYYPNNFDNIASSMVTLFELMVVNNWFITMGGVVAVTSRWSRLFFIGFYICSVFVVINLVVAFIIEAFILKYEQTTLQQSQLAHWKERVRKASARLPTYQSWNFEMNLKIGEFYKELYAEDDLEQKLQFDEKKKQLYAGVSSLITDYHKRHSFIFDTPPLSPDESSKSKRPTSNLSMSLGKTLMKNKEKDSPL